MKIVFENLQEIINLLEDKKQEKREIIGKTRTKLESHEAKGYVQGLDEAVYFLRHYEKQHPDGVPTVSVQEKIREREYPTEVMEAEPDRALPARSRK